MQEPIWVLDEAVEAIHNRQLAEHGGATGVRDAGLLASALARPKNLFAYEAEDITLPRLAAAYAFGIARNHPFVDGNKRTAFVVSLLFLRLNGFTIVATQEQRYETFLALAEGRFDEAELGAWFEHWCRPAAALDS
ncbi:MAG TPA: type II toxin-antitoxin system death-on-curing family toxin [Burkholderiaceae bacterium]|nr:type II toxin-antitoxin system death-on-curing family toxin [Burkholderiaceae bacterium]